jgi:hypothetical protein
MNDGNRRMPPPPQHWQPPVHPQQPGYPQQPGFQQQPGYPQQPGHPQQPGYPMQSAYPQQQGFPPQPGRLSPSYPHQQQPGTGVGPLTLAGWGAPVIGVGVVLILVGMFALPWAFGLSFLDLGRRSGSAGDDFFVGMAETYVHYLGFILVICQPLATLPWSLGALRTQKSARLLSNVRSRELRRGTFGWYRTVFTGRATLMFLIQAFGIVSICDGKLDQLKLLQAGPWVLLVGAAVVAVGTFVGPRPGPALPN